MTDHHRMMVTVRDPKPGAHRDGSAVGVLPGFRIPEFHAVLPSVPRARGDRPTPVLEHHAGAPVAPHPSSNPGWRATPCAARAAHPIRPMRGRRFRAVRPPDWWPRNSGCVQPEEWEICSSAAKSLESEPSFRYRTSLAMLRILPWKPWRGHRCGVNPDVLRAGVANVPRDRPRDRPSRGPWKLQNGDLESARSRG